MEVVLLTEESNVFEKTLELISEDPKYIDILSRIIDYEDEHHKDEYFEKLGWTYDDVVIPPHILYQLFLRGILKRVYKSRKYTGYLLANREETRRALNAFKKMETEKPKETETIVIPNDLFDVIENFEDIKEFIKMCLRAKEPVHVLLVGPPGTAKSLFLMELERLGGHFIVGSTSTRVGIRDLLYESLPRILIIDEIDKIKNGKELSALLTWMDYGRIVVTKHGLRSKREGKGWVFAAANRIDKLPPELLDRFRVIKIKPYTREQFIRVVTNFLTKRMSVPKELARYIAEKVVTYRISVRAARDIARMCNSKEAVDKAVKFLKNHS